MHDQVRNKVPVAFEDFGQKTVKNIVRPLHVFGLRPEVIDALPIVDERILHGPTAQVGAYFSEQTPRLSVVVLPFANFSDGGEQQYLVDAITDDVTTDLSRIADIVVISRNTADTYRDKPMNTRQIGRELNVRYVLKGSVRRAQDQIRVNTQLSDAGTDMMVWADRFHYSSTDLFRLQDEVTGRIAIALNLELVSAEAARPTDHPGALDHLLRGRAALDHREGSTPDRLTDAINCFESALAFDPGSAAYKSLPGAGAGYPRS